jgi:DNA-directed RNA polymerase specialized sigma24 family protein
MAGRQVPNGADFDGHPELATWQPLDGAVLAVERKQVVDDLVNRLPRRSQILLRLLIADSPLSYREISESMSMPIGSIGPTRARALEQLRRLAETAGVNLGDVFFV